MTPKIIFKYSWIYDQNWKKWIKIYIKKEDKNYPTTPEVLSYIKKVESMWHKYEKKVLGEMSKLTGLKWKEKNITCYVVGNCFPFSDPLTIKAYKEHDYFIDTLIHESIHQLFTQNGNSERVAKVKKYYEKKYAGETRRTQIHIHVHAIHQHLFLKFFGQKRLDRQIEKMNKYPDYKKAWDIVREEGYQNIIGEFKKHF